MKANWNGLGGAALLLATKAVILLVALVVLLVTPAENEHPDQPGFRIVQYETGE